MCEVNLQYLLIGGKFAQDLVLQVRCSQSFKWLFGLVGG